MAVPYGHFHLWHTSVTNRTVITPVRRCTFTGAGTLFASHIHSIFGHAQIWVYGFPSAITIKGVHNAAMPKYGVCHNDDVTRLLIWLCLMSALSMTLTSVREHRHRQIGTLWHQVRHPTGGSCLCSLTEVKVMLSADIRHSHIRSCVTSSWWHTPYLGIAALGTPFMVMTNRKPIDPYLGMVSYW